MLFMLLQAFVCTNAQPFKTQAAARDYFATHISELDPIEGIYDAENVVVASIPGYGAQRKVQNFTWAIWKKEIEGEDPMYMVESVAGDYKGVMSAIERIGETMTYKLMRSDARNQIHEERFELEDLFAFGYSYRDALGNATSTVTLRATKKYPTRSMYEAAFKKATEEASLPQKWTGSGFALKDGYVVTNHHVIENAKSIKIRGIKGDFSQSYNASVAISDKNNDIALIKINDSNFQGFGNIPYAIASTTSEVGEDVFVLGYPLTATMGDEIKYTTGVISSKTGFQGDISLYQISAPIQPGNSGGPLFDSKGNIIGIVSSKHSEAENVGYAIKSLFLKSLIESYSSVPIIPDKLTISTNTRPDQIKIVKPFVFLIECAAE